MSYHHDSALATTKAAVAAMLIGATTWLAGCGAPPATTPGGPVPQRELLDADAKAEAKDAKVEAKDAHVEAKDAKAGAWAERKAKMEAAKKAFLDALDLTEEQRAKIEALHEHEKQGTMSAQRLNDLAEILAAPKLDKEALAAFARSQVEARDKAMEAKIAKLAAFREILTPEQRQKATTLSLDFLATHGRGMGRGKAMGHGPGHGRGRAAMIAAISSFMLSGDQATLEKALKPEGTVEERVDAITSRYLGMSATRRATLAERMKARAARMAAKEAEEAKKAKEAEETKETKDDVAKKA